MEAVESTKRKGRDNDKSKQPTEKKKKLAAPRKETKEVDVSGSDSTESTDSRNLSEEEDEEEDEVVVVDRDYLPGDNDTYCTYARSSWGSSNLARHGDRRLRWITEHNAKKVCENCDIPFARMYDGSRQVRGGTYVPIFKGIVISEANNAVRVCSFLEVLCWRIDV